MKGKQCAAHLLRQPIRLKERDNTAAIRRQGCWTLLHQRFDLRCAAPSPFQRFDIGAHCADWNVWQVCVAVTHAPQFAVTDAECLRQIL